MTRVEPNFAAPTIEPLLPDARPLVAALTGERVLFAALLLAHLIPVWAFSHFATDDGPSHVYNAAVLRDYSQPGSDLLREYFVLSTTPDPNWFGHLVLAGLMYVLPAAVAEKMIVSGYVILLPLAMRYAVRAIRPGAEFLAVLAFPFVFNFTLLKGFYNFSYSIVVFFFLVGYWIRYRDEFNWKRTIALALLSLLLYFCHIVSLAMAYALIGTLAIAFVACDRRNVRSRMILPMVAFVPTLALVAAFVAKQGLAGEGLPLAHKLMKLASLYSLVLYDRREALLTGWLAFFLAALALYAFWRNSRDRWDALLAVAALFAVVCILAPDRLSGGGLIIDRLVLFPYFVVILYLAVHAWTIGQRRAVQAVAVSLAVVLLAWRIPAQAKLSAMMDEYVTAAAHVSDGSTVLSLPFSDRVYASDGRVVSFRIFPFKHATGRLAAGRNVVDLANYEATTGYFPVRFRADRDITALASLEREMDAVPAVDLAEYEQRSGGRIDYILLWQVRDEQRGTAAAADVFRQLDAGYEKVFTSSSGLVELYRRRTVTG